MIFPIFPIRRLFSFFWSLSRDKSFFGKLVQKHCNTLLARAPCSENNSTIRWLLYWYKRYPVLCKIFKNTIFISANTFEKYIICKNYCIAQHDDKMCFLPSCRYDILTMGYIDELLQKLHSFWLTILIVDCLFTLFKYRISGKVVNRSGQVLDNVQRAVYFRQRNKIVDKMPCIAKQRLMNKKNKENFLSYFQTTKSTETTGSVFAETKELNKKNKFELELLK